MVAVSYGDFIAVEALEERHEDLSRGAQFLTEFGGGALAVFLEIGSDGSDGRVVGFFAEGDLGIEGDNLLGPREEAVGGFVIRSGLELAREGRSQAGAVEGLEDLGGGSLEFRGEFEGVALVADEVVADAEVVFRKPAKKGIEEAGDADGGAEVLFQKLGAHACVIGVGLVVVLDDFSARFGEVFPEGVKSDVFVADGADEVSLGEFFEGALNFSRRKGEGPRKSGDGEKMVTLEVAAKDETEVGGIGGALDEKSLAVFVAEVAS